VDNSTDAGAQRTVDRVVREEAAASNCRPPTIAERRGNIGLSRALNHGLSLGLEGGYELFLLLDQDSVLEPGACSALAEAYSELSPRVVEVELAARNVEERPSLVQDLLEQVFYRSARAGDPAPRECVLAMTSGLLIPARVLRRVGFFDESFFLDAVDHEFCLRSAKLGIRLFLIPSATVRHALGAPARDAWGPFSFELRNADATRLFYSTRDGLRLIRRYWTTRPFVCTVLLGFLTARTVVYGLVPSRAPGAVQAMRRGALEFLRTRDEPAIPGGA